MISSYLHNSRGSLILDFMIAFSICILFIGFIYSTNGQSRLLLSRARESHDFISAYKSSGDLTSSPGSMTSKYNLINKDFGDDFSSRYMFSSSSDLLLHEIFPKNDIVKANSHDLCYPRIDQDYNFGSYKDYKNLFKTSTSSYDIIQRQINIPIKLGINPTDLVVRNNIAYISLDSAEVGDPDLIALDISDFPPKTISSINTGPGISSIALMGDKIVASVLSSTNQIQLINIANDRSLTLTTKYKLPLPYATATPPQGSSINFNYPYIYLGTSKWDGDEFNILSIDGNNLSKLSGVDISSKVNHIDYDDKSIYISSSNQNQLLKFDYEGSSILKSILFSPSGYLRQDGKISIRYGNSLYFGRTNGGFDLIGDHEIFGFPDYRSDPDLQYPLSQNISGGIYGLVGNMVGLFAISRIPDSEFIIFDDRLSKIQTSSLPISPRVLRCDNDSLYVLANNAPFIIQLKIKKNE